MTTTATKEKKQLGPTEVLTPEFRVSYPNVFEARSAKPGDKPKFSLQMLFRTGPPQDGEKTVDLSALKAAALAAAIEKWGSDRAKWPQNLHNPFRDGAARGDKAGYGAGVVFVSTSSEFKPGVVDQNVQDIIDANQFYPGCYARAKLVAYGWEYMGKAGVSFGLRHLQLIRDGEPLGGGSSPKDDFDAIPVPTTGGTKTTAAVTNGGQFFGDL